MSNRWRKAVQQMKFRYITDCHMHSKNSPDAQDSVVLMCENAARMGLYAVAVTDHCECNVYRQEEYDKAIRTSYLQTRNADNIYRDLHVLAGVELGQPAQAPEDAEELLSSMEFDFVIGSVHNVPNREDFYYLRYTEENAAQILDEYFDELMATIRWGNFDTLAHITYPWRYIERRDGIIISMERYRDRFDQVFRMLIQKEKALEINTSDLRNGGSEAAPGFELLKRYRELGGKLVTIGSDAHRWMDVGAGIEMGLEMLSRAGFRYFTVYAGRKPQFLPIE